MSDFFIQIPKIMESSQAIIKIAIRLKELKADLDNIKSDGILDGTYKFDMDKSIKQMFETISNEAAKLASLGKALEYIVNEYREMENDIIQIQLSSLLGVVSNIGLANLGTDKRNWYEKLWDWIKNEEPDVYDATSDEQEKAKDTAMKKELWNVLQDEKYSPENWDRSSLYERKQILQNYMNEVIEIYGVQEVDTDIIWDSKATYSDKSVTWGYYTHSKHSVTLNENVLTDNIENWDSYDLIETVSHELRHAYQQEAVDNPTDYMVSKETIELWKENFDNYISSGTDYKKYREQPVEVDARDFQINRNDKIT